MKTARVQVLTTPAFRDWLRKEAKNSGISVAELVRTRCEGGTSEEDKAVAELAAHLRKEVRRAQSSLRASLTHAEALIAELRAKRKSREVTESA